MRLSPKAKRNITRIIPFAIIWMLSGWIVIITELAVTQDQEYHPATGIAFTLPVLIFANLANLFVGGLVGGLEVVYLQKRFSRHKLRTKFFYKFLIYFSLFFSTIVLFFPIAYSLNSGVPVYKAEGWIKMTEFLLSLTMLTTLFQMSVSLFMCLTYSAMSENLGHQVFWNLLSGKYHHPKVEKRIFMFLDMKSSTTIAEEIGHVKYFNLLQEYYDVMSDPIINSFGEVYQYIGDEIVISWNLEKGLERANCVRCFFEIRENMAKNQQKFKTRYGFEIDFKAGLHYGEVTTGEVGALKKEIVFTGDVLNTTARIQGRCNELKSAFLISGVLKNLLPANDYHFENKGDINLKGKHEKAELYSVSKAD